MEDGVLQEVRLVALGEGAVGFRLTLGSDSQEVAVSEPELRELLQGEEICVRNDVWWCDMSTVADSIFFTIEGEFFVRFDMRRNQFGALIRTLAPGYRP